MHYNNCIFIQIDVKSVSRFLGWTNKKLYITFTEKYMYKKKWEDGQCSKNRCNLTMFKYDRYFYKKNSVYYKKVSNYR